MVDSQMTMRRLGHLCIEFHRGEEGKHDPVFRQNIGQPTNSGSGFILIPNSLLPHNSRRCALICDRCCQVHATSRRRFCTSGRCMEDFSELHFESRHKSFTLNFSPSAHYYTCQLPAAVRPSARPGGSESKSAAGSAN